MKFNSNFLLVFIYLLLIISYAPTRGFFSFGGFYLILIVFLSLLFLSFHYRNGGGPKIVDTGIILSALFICISLSIIYYGGLYQENLALIRLSQLILLLCSPLSFLYFQNNLSYLKFISKHKFLILVGIAALLRIMMVVSSPHPLIDVFNSLKIGSKALAELKNPYTITFPQVYPNQIPILYGYFPGSAILLLPFSLFLNDPRYAYVLADIGSALLLFKILTKFSKRKTINSELIPLIFLYNPMALFVIEQAWLEPLITFFIYLFIFLYLKNKKSYLPFIILGISMSIKQPVALIFIPVLLKLKWNIKQILATLFVSTFIIIPFFLWNQKKFIFNLTAGFNPIYNTAPITRALNLTGYFYQTLGNDFSLLIRLLGITLLSSIIFLKTKRDMLGFLYSYLLFSLTVTIFYTQAFLNYYTFISSLILLLITFSIITQTQQDE